MNPQTATAVTDSNSAPLHCRHRTASGRRCRLPAVAGMAISAPDSRLCRKHAAERQVDRFAVAHNKDLDQADLAAALIGDIEEFRSAADINHSLGELYKLQARNKITPRRAECPTKGTSPGSCRASVLAYITNQLLHSHRAVDREAVTNDVDAEENASQDSWLEVIPDLPRPDCEDDVPVTTP